MNSDNPYKIKSEEIISSYEDDIYYENRFKNVILAKHIKSQDTLNEIQLAILPIIRFVVNSMSTLYNKKVIRTLNTENKKINDLFSKVSLAFDNESIQIDRYTKLSGMLALKSHFNNEESKLEYVIYNNNMIEYTPLPDDYNKMKELSLEFKYDNVKQEEIWDDLSYTKMVDGSQLSNEENPYGFIPFSIFRDKKLSNSFYCPPATNLLMIQDYISNQLTQIGNNFKYQSMDMIVVKGGGDLKSMNIGASAVNKVDVEDSIEFVSPGTDLNSLVDVVDSQLKLFSRINGIPDSLLSASSTSSGVAITISQKVLDDYVEERAKLFISTEKEALLKGLKVLGYHNNITIPDNLEISINYTSVNKAIKMTKEDLDIFNSYIEKGIYTNVDLMMATYPNMSRIDAEEKLKENKEYTNNFNKNLNKEDLNE